MHTHIHNIKISHEISTAILLRSTPNEKNEARQQSHHCVGPHAPRNSMVKHMSVLFCIDVGKITWHIIYNATVTANKISDRTDRQHPNLILLKWLINQIPMLCDQRHVQQQMASVSFQKFGNRKKSKKKKKKKKKTAELACPHITPHEAVWRCGMATHASQGVRC